jgi:hypothetical protein
MVPTCALSARPLPVMAALASLGVCRATGRPRRAAQTRAMPLAGGAHDGAEVVLGEDPLDGDGVGADLVEPLLDAAFDAQQALGQVLVGAGADGVGADEAQGAADGALDGAHAAPGEPRVDSQHTHAPHTFLERSFAPC